MIPRLRILCRAPLFAPLGVLGLALVAGAGIFTPGCNRNDVCGNGVQTALEACDNGENNILEEYGAEGDCQMSCELAGYCGDGVVQPDFEDCEPGEGVDCTPACTLPTCGDAVVTVGEECDLGPENGSAACTVECKLPVCGDGIVQPELGEVCDAGVNNVTYSLEQAACYVGCTSQGPYCGDGVQDDVEECDAGDANVSYSVEQGACYIDCSLSGPYCGDEVIDEGEACDLGAGNLEYSEDGSGCSRICTLDDVPYCGDGIMDGPEGCDLGTENNGTGQGCTTTCGVSARVFVTSEGYTGDLGGRDGADIKCQALAQTLGGDYTFFAWIDTNEEPNSPSERFAKHEGPYVLTDGTPVAMSWEDLVDGELLAPISLTEEGLAVNDSDAFVWTRISADGTNSPDLAADCSGWTNGTQGFSGWVGDLEKTDAGWTNHTFVPCHIERRLYCFEQVE